jgi:hypothetical protein
MPVPVDETLAPDPIHPGATRPLRGGETPSGTSATAAPPRAPRAPEAGGPSGPEPTRYGDWERGGRCIDF